LEESRRRTAEELTSEHKKRRRTLRRPPTGTRQSRPRTDHGLVKEEASQKHFPIVGIGASAGGLEAFTQLLKNLPVDTGMAFVLVQHLDPEHESALTQILSRATTMPVAEVTNHLRVQANYVYVIPPNTR